MEDIEIEEEGHDFEDVEYTWNEDCTECSAKHVCKNNNEHYKIIVSTEVYSEVGLAPTNKSKGIIRFTPKFNENWANTFMDVDIPVLTDAKYMLEENLSESTAYKYGKGRYKYSYKGKVYEFISETKLKDMNYYLENKYFTSLANSYLYDGYSQENVDAMIETIKNNNVKAYNNKALKEMVDDYNLNHEIPLKVNIIKEKPMLNKILYEVITNADYDIQLLAYIKDETLNVFDKSNFVITENPLLLQKEIEIALAKKNIINKTIIVNDEILLINDNMNNNCTLFDMIGELEVNDFEDLMSKDGRFLINVRQTSSYYTIPQSVEYVLASALENQVSQITIPNTVRYIGDFGLSYIGKVNVEEGSNLEFIGMNGLANCGDIELIKFTKLKVIDDKAFLGSKVENINLKNVEIIGEMAFENCNNVKNISLGNYVKVIKSNAFKIETKNQNEIKVLIPISTKVIGKNVFLNREKVEVYLEENLGEEWIDGWNNITSDGIIKTKVYKYNALEPVSLSLPVGIDGYWHYDDNMNMVKW